MICLGKLKGNDTLRGDGKRFYFFDIVQLRFLLKGNDTLRGDGNQ